MELLLLKLATFQGKCISQIRNITVPWLLQVVKSIICESDHFSLFHRNYFGQNMMYEAYLQMLFIFTVENTKSCNFWLFQYFSFPLLSSTLFMTAMMIALITWSPWGICTCTAAFSNTFDGGRHMAQVSPSNPSTSP